MAAGIEYTSRRAGVGRSVKLGLVTNIIVVTLLVLVFRFKYPEVDVVPVIAMAAVALLVTNLLIYLNFRESEKDLLDTLSFDILLDKGDSDERTRHYMTIVKLVEGHLVQNRITFDAHLEGHRFGGPTVPYSKAFFLRAYGLTMKVKREKTGQSTGVVNILLGPVSGPKDRVARRLLEGLRQELLRSEKEAMPENKA